MLQRRIPAARFGWSVLATAGFVGIALVGSMACRQGAAAVPATAGPRLASTSAARPAVAAPTAAPAYPPDSWMALLQPSAAGRATAIACLDVNGDLRLDSRDSADLLGLDIPLVAGDVCLPPAPGPEWFVEEGVSTVACDAATPAPALVVVIAGGGSKLLDVNQGVSVGLVDIANQIRGETAGAGIPTKVILTTSAIDAADLPQTRMAEWLTVYLGRLLARAPCLRVILMGHSHGAVIATSVITALEPVYGAQLFGVLLDRSLLYYDSPGGPLPASAAILNIYQTNEGWHGASIDAPNVTDIDASGEEAPREPREGPLPIVAVAHSTLDDAPGVQSTATARVLAWLRADQVP
jgi:hypothetical protein